MLTKKEIKDYIEKYHAFRNYVNDLAELHVDIWEDKRVGTFDDAYIELLCKAAGVEIDEDVCNWIEDLLFDDCVDEEDLDEEINKHYKNYFSVEEEKPKPIDWAEFFTDLLDGTMFSVAIRKAEEDDE